MNVKNDELVSALDKIPDDFDLSRLKVEMNNVTIMHGPPSATLKQAEKAMMAYLEILLGNHGNRTR